MSSPFICEPHENGVGRKLSCGSELGLFPADPPGSYVIRALLPVGCEVTMGLSNEAAASLLTLLMMEFDAGRLRDGLAIMDAELAEKHRNACPHCGTSPLVIVTRGGLMGIRTPMVPVCQTCGGKIGKEAPDVH